MSLTTGGMQGDRRKDRRPTAAGRTRRRTRAEFAGLRRPGGRPHSAAPSTGGVIGRDRGPFRADMGRRNTDGRPAARADRAGGGPVYHTGGVCRIFETWPFLNRAFSLFIQY